MDVSCKGQRVVVTAGAGGIGRAIAEAFVAAGARVFVCDVDARALDAMLASERLDRVIAARAKARGVSADEARDQLVARVSLRRMVSVDDIANITVFLASCAGANISGQELSVCANVETMA